MTQQSYSLKEIKNDKISPEQKKYFLHGYLVNDKGEKIFLDNTSIFLNNDEYYNLITNQKVIISLDEIVSIFKSVPIIKEPKIPFPQVDNFERFIGICEKLYQHESLSKEQIMSMFDIKPRHYNFNVAAGKYLGIINNESTTNISLNQIGIGIFSLDIKQRYLAIVSLILRHKPFHDLFRFFLDNERMPTTDEIFHIFKTNKLYNLNSDVTLKRRAQSASSWIKWILNLMEYEKISQNDKIQSILF